MNRTYSFTLPDGEILTVFFRPDPRAVERLGEEGAWEEYIDHFISAGSEWTGIRLFDKQRVRATELILDLLRLCKKLPIPSCRIYFGIYPTYLTKIPNPLKTTPKPLEPAPGFNPVEAEPYNHGL